MTHLASVQWASNSSAFGVCFDFCEFSPAQVKENRMKHQKALEFQRQEESLKKAILSEARLQAQEEDRRKALQAKKEEEEIQREIVKLRKEMAEKKHTMAKIWRM